MGNTLSFDTGIKTFTVNDSVDISFNPTDTEFVNRFYEAAERIDADQRQGREQVNGNLDEYLDKPKEVYGFAQERDANVRKEIDLLFGEGIADKLFPGINCYAYADGFPIWMNFFTMITDVINESITEEQKKTDPRVKAYSKKYDKMLAKYKNTAPTRQSQAQ